MAAMLSLTTSCGGKDKDKGEDDMEDMTYVVHEQMSFIS